MKTKLGVLAVALIAGGAMFARTSLSIGVGVGGFGPGNYPPPAYAQYVPRCPGPDYRGAEFRRLLAVGIGRSRFIRLFVPQGHHRVHGRGASCGKETSQQSRDA